MKKQVLFIFAFVLLATLSGIAQTKPATNRPADAVNPKEIRPDQIVDGRWTPDKKLVPTPKATTTPEESQEIVATVVEAPTPVDDEGGPSPTVILLSMAGLIVLFLLLRAIFSESKNKTQKPIPPPHIRGNY